MATVEERIQRLEDHEEIRRLKIEYARVVDRFGSGDEYAALFTEDAVIDAGAVGGVLTGRAAIRDFFNGIRNTLTFFVHYMMGETIDILPSGTYAVGHWYLWEPATYNGQAVWIAITYDDEYKKVNGQWRCSFSRLNFHFMTPYDQGWVKKPMSD